MGKITGFLEYERLSEANLPVPERVKNYKEFVIHLSDEQAKVQGARCMDCGIPFCMSGCPVNNIIPDWNDLVYKWQEPLYQNNIQPEFANRWKVPGDENRTNIPRYAYNTTIDNGRNIYYYTYSNLNSFDASYAKIREITLSYDVAKGLVRRIHAEGLTFRAQVSNLMLWKKNHLGIDPEFQSPAGNRNIRTGQGTITIGAHLTL